MHTDWRTAAILAVVAAMLWGGRTTSAQTAPAQTAVPLRQPPARTDIRDAATVVLYSQPPRASGGLLLSSLRDPGGSGSDQWVWDDFTLDAARPVTEIQWRGGYDPILFGLGGPVFDFEIAIYPSIPAGTAPDVAHPPLVHYQVGGNAGETPAEVLGGVQTYDYRFSLPVPFQPAQCKWGCDYGSDS